MLRGINVSGKNLLKMADLKQLMLDLSFKEVETYIQSGNIVFSSESTDTDWIAAQISKEIEVRMGFNVPVLVLAATDLHTIFAQNPYPQQTDILHITFLASAPTDDALSRIERAKYLPDVFICSEKAIYLICPNGYGNTQLHNQFFERKLKVKATTRNWKTVTELVRMSTR